jgi:ParB family chromosome partitioning protein
MAKRIALGKGLDSLIPQVETVAQEGNKLLELDISEIRPNPSQPRTYFDEEALQELANSIKTQGILQPLVVRRKGIGYEIVVGERRWRAAQKAELKTVPAILIGSSDEKTLELALVENIQRQDLNALEEAVAFKMLIDKFDLTQEQLAKQVSKSRAAVANTLRLLKLHDDVKKHLLVGDIEMGHARALLALPDQISQRKVCEIVISKRMNVRQVEALIKERLSTKDLKPKKEEKDTFLKDAELQLSKSLQSRVNIVSGKKGGKIEIKYTTDSDLQRLFDLLAGK